LSSYACAPLLTWARHNATLYDLHSQSLNSACDVCRGASGGCAPSGCAHGPLTPTSTSTQSTTTFTEERYIGSSVFRATCLD
jgi:hypothetical protein